MQELKLIIVSIFIVNLAHSQVANFESISLDKKNAIQAYFGLDMAVLAGVEYSRVVEIKQNPYLISGSVTLPMGSQLLDDSKFAVNFSSLLLKRNNWQLPANVGLFTTSASNRMNSITTVGAHLAINPGYYKKFWFLASEITYDKFMLSYIKNSDFYKVAYYSEAKDAWYKNSGGNFHFGIITGKTIKNTQLNLRGGIVLTEKFNTTLVPYYVQIGYRYLF